MNKEETKLQNKITKYLDYLIELNLPIDYEKRDTRGFSYKKGIPDLYIIINGIHIEIEIKVGDNIRSPMQIKYEEKCKRINCKYWLIYDYQTFLGNLKKELLLINKKSPILKIYLEENKKIGN